MTNLHKLETAFFPWESHLKMWPSVLVSQGKNKIGLRWVLTFKSQLVCSLFFELCVYIYTERERLTEVKRKPNKMKKIRNTPITVHLNDMYMCLQVTVTGFWFLYMCACYKLFICTCAFEWLPGCSSVFRFFTAFPLTRPYICMYIYAYIMQNSHTLLIFGETWTHDLQRGWDLPVTCTVGPMTLWLVFLLQKFMVILGMIFNFLRSMFLIGRVSQACGFCNFIREVPRWDCSCLYQGKYFNFSCQSVTAYIEN